MTHPDHLASGDAADLAGLLDASPKLAAAAAHVRSFADMKTRRQGLLALEDWLTAVEAGDQPALRSFAHGIRRDQQAVTAGLALPYSSGALEGKNCKIKYLKRLMYGRRLSFNGQISGGSMAAGSYSPARGETEWLRCVTSRITSGRCSEQALKSAYTRCQR